MSTEKVTSISSGSVSNEKISGKSGTSENKLSSSRGEEILKFHLSNETEWLGGTQQTV